MANLLHAELVNIALFFWVIFIVGCVMGVIPIACALIGHELWKRVHRG